MKQRKEQGGIDAVKMLRYNENKKESEKPRERKA